MTNPKNPNTTPSGPHGDTGNETIDLISRAALASAPTNSWAGFDSKPLFDEKFAYLADLNPEKPF